MTLRFGTDGVRGVAHVELTPEFVLALGRAAARVLPGNAFYIGRDTRESGPTLQASLTSGITAEGRDVFDLGIVPTPAVAWASAQRPGPGAVVSASHNPYTDNGIKFFAAGGMKLSDATEDSLEAELRRILDGRPPSGGEIGRHSSDPGWATTYKLDLLRALDGRTLDGVHVVVDCANGAAFEMGPDVFRAAGATVDVINAEPDGRNINDKCGSTYPQALQRTVTDRGADVGLAFDGDADRVLAVDDTGRIVDGDHLLALFARDLKDQGRLAHDTLVVTVMSNLGLKLAMKDAGVNVVETKVGDRYVLEAMEEGEYVLGGEQSGHIIFAEHATTGDGLLAGLLMVDLIRRAGRPLSKLATEAMTSLPQVLRNVRVGDRDGLAAAAPIWTEVSAVEAELGDEGRVLLRPSGTEPLIRVMVEAADAATAAAAADRLVKVVEATLGTATPSL